ncbi:hypothetical protein JZ968_06465 [Riemerella anatipestifer]
MDIKELYEEFKNNGGTLSMEDFAVMHSSLDPSEDTPIDDVKKKEYPTLQNTEGIVPKSVLEELQGHSVNQIPETEPTPINQTLDFLALATTGVSPSMALESETGVSSSTENYKTTTPFSENLPIEPSNNIEGNISTPITVDSINEDIIHPNIDSINRIKNTLNKVSTQIPNISNSSISESISQTENIDFDKVAEVLPSAYTNPIVEHGNIISEFVPKDYKGKFEIPTLYKELTVISNNQEEALTNLEANEKNGVLKITRGNDGKPIKNSEGQYMFTITDQDYLNNEFIPYVKKLNEQIGEDNTEIAREGLGKAIHDFEEGIKPPASPLQDFYRDYFEITGKPFDQSDIGRISTKQDRDNYLLEAEAMVEAEKTGNDYQSIYQQKIENRNKEWANDTQKAISFVNEMLKGVDVSATQKNGNTDYTINGYGKEKEVIQDILKNETLKNYFISFWKEYGDNYYGGGVMRQRNILYQQKGRAEVLDAFDEYIMNRYSSDYEANKEIVNHYSIKTKEAISKKDKNSLVSALGNIENSYQNINNSQQSFNDIERFQLKRLAAQKEVYKEKIEQGQAEADHDNRLLGTLKSYPLAVINRAIDAGKGLVLGIPHFVNEVLIKSDDARYLLEKASAPTKIGNVITGGVFDRVNEYEIDNKTIIEKNGMYFEKSDNGNKPIVLTTAQKSKLNLKNSYRDFSVKGLFGTVAEQVVTMLGAEFAGAKALGLTSKVLSRGIASASKVYGSESAFVNMLRNGLRFSKNPTNNGIIGWTNATLLDNGEEAKALGLSGTEYAVSTLVKSMTTGLMSKVNPDVTFFKSAKTLEEGLIQALRDGNSGAIKGLINNFTSGVTKSMLKEVPGELLQEYLEIPAATLAELTTTAITQKNTITPYTVDQIIDTGIETAATVASLGLISHTRGVGKSFEKDGLFINVGKLSDRERISLLANIYDENTFKNFKHDFGVKQEVIDRIENKVTTVKKYIDQIPNKENYSLSDMFTIGVKLQEVEHLEQKRDNAKEVFKNIYDADIKAAQKVISDIVYNKNNVIETDKNNQSSSETITSNEPEIETQKVNESSESSRIDSSKDNMMKKDEAITINNTPNTSVNNDVPYSTTNTEKTEDNGKLNSDINEDEVLDSILNNPTFIVDNDNATEQELENASDTSPTITNDKLDTKLNSNPTDTQIEIKPLSEISTDENRFQARKKLNETVINNIANNYSEKDQDPIHVWQDPKDGKTYVLSGHHRYYGAKQAGRNDVKIIDRTKDFTEEEANANRSMETPLERAATLRQKRERNDAREDINDFLNREGKNKRLVHNLSYLNPKGKAVQSVASFENSSNSDSKRETEKIADWIGEARRIFGDKLTDAHENEMFDFLNDKEASKRFSKKGDFVEKVRHIVGGMYYDSNAPLNLKRIENKGNAEMEYENEMRELKNKAAEYDAQISNIDDRFTNAKREDYISPDAKDFKEVKEIARKEKERLKNEQKAIYNKIDKLQREKGKYIKADIAQPTLFQKGNVNTKTISKKAFDELIERLKKPFAKTFKNLNVTTDWETFKNRLNALGNIGNLEDLAFFQNLPRVNEKFNKELDQLIKGTLPKGHIFQLGKPSPILKSSGIPNLPIELNADRLKRKSEQENHLFDLENVKNLSTAIQYPIAVFDSTKKDGSKVILTDIKDKKGSNYVVAMRLSHKGRGRHQIEINDIKSVYPKEHYLGIIDWINSNDNLLKFADKEKVLNYISVQSTNLIGNGNIAKDGTNVHQKVEKAKQSIQDFQNPISDKEVSDIQFSILNKNDKSKQLSIILKTNPAPNEYNTWIRSEEDILTAEEAFESAFQDGEMYPDFTTQDMKNALNNGEITVYSSKPIEDGNFVTPSKMNAENYAGGGKIYSKTMKLSDIAWIDEGEGQVAKIQFMQTPNGEIYGAKLPDGTIYINPNKLNANTPIHEFSHLWEQLMPNAWKRGVELLKQTEIGKDIFGKLKSEGNYPNLTDEQLWSEALNTHIGNYGEWQYHSTALQKLGQWLKNLFQKLGDFIKYKGKLSPDTKLYDFTKGVLGDLLGNNELIGEEGFNHHKGKTQYSKQDLRHAAKEMIGKVVSLAFNRKKGTESITVGYFNDYAKSLIEEVSGLKLKHRVSFEINESNVRHSIKEHFGKNETDSRNHPIQKEDYDKILDIASNPDRIVYIGVDGKTGLKLFSFQKEYENGGFAIVKFIGKSGGRLSFKTFYQNKKGIHQRQNADLKQSPSANAQTRSVAFPSYDANVQNLLNFETDTNKEYVDNHINNDNNDIRFHIIGDNQNEESNNISSIITDTELYDNLMPITTLQSVASAVQENDLAKAKSILENSSWYKGLSQKDKKLVDGQSVKNVVVQQAKKRQEYKKLQTPEGIKEVFENKINQYKNAKLDTRSKIALKREAQRQAAYAIKQYVVKNKMKKKLMPGQANKLIKLATEISYPRQNLKSVYGKIEKFIATYEAIQQSNYDKVMNKLNDGVSIDDIHNQEQKKIAERIKEREEAKTAPKGKGFKIQEEAFSESESAIKNNKPKKKYVREIIQSYTDRQFVPKLLLEASGMDNAYNRFINVQGANGRAKEWMDKLNEKVYDGIYGKEYQMLNKIIDARATISIDQYREKEGLPPIDHHNGFNQYYAQDALNGIKEALGNKRFDELNNRASAYFAFHHEIVDKLHDNGIISEDTAKILKAREYSPRFFLEHMEDFEGNIDQQHSEIFNNSSGKLSKGAVQSLGEGSKGLKVNDTQYLMTNYVNKMSQLIAQNELNKTFAVRELPKAKQRYEVLKNQNKLSADERRFVKYFKELESKVVLNPITGITPSGNLKYEHDAAPKGFSKNYYYDDGVRQEFFLANELHNQWNDLNKGFLGEGADKESIAKYSGSALVKNFATGNNPFFFISNTPRDFLQTALVSDQYSTFSPLGWGQVFKDALIGIRENWKHRDGKVSLMDKYIEYGGMMDFLNKQGMIKKDGYWSRNENRAINVFNIMSLKQLNNYSEVMFRVGLMNRTLNNQLKAYNKEHNTNYKSVEELDQQTKDDMYYRAVREARSVLDFNQGGTITKDLEAFTPYINAATQGSRVIATAFRKNPGETTLKMLQTGTFLSGATYAMSMLLISALKGDDDEDKSITEIYLETLNGVNEIVRRSNFIIPLGIKDEEGNWKYITIAKSQEMQPLFTLVDRVMENIARESVGQKTLDWKFITNEVRLSFDNALPINPFHNPLSNESQVIDLAAKNPLIKGAIAIGYGINPFTKQPVSSDAGKVSISQEGMNDSRIEGFYKTLFPMIGMSPARTKTFVEGIITQPTTNPFISFIYAGADLMTGNSDSDKLMNNLYKAATKRVLRETSEFNYKMNLDKEHKRELESMKESADKNNAELKSLVKYAIDNNLESYEAYDYFESKIEQMNLSETEKKAYYKKAKDNFKQRNTNYTTDKYDSMLYSIRGESDPEVKARMIKVYFGDDIPEEVRERGKQLGNIFTKRVNKILEEDD